MKIDNIYKYVIDIRRKFHKIPEVGFKEFKTSNLIKEELDKLNIEYETALDTGVIGYINKGKKNRIALRADIDGLPILEKNNLPFKSIHEGYMHACGHDSHMAIQLGLAKLLKHLEHKLNYEIVLIFQPAEETDGGALPLINGGYFNNIDYSLGLHVTPYTKSGSFRVKSGVNNGSSDLIEINVRGHKAHGAYPQEGVDSIVTAAHLITGIQSLISREATPQHSATLTFGKISGGTAINVICDNVTLSGTLRTDNQDTRKYLKKRIIEYATILCEAYRCDCNVNIKSGYTSLINDDNLANIVKSNIINMFGKDKLEIIEYPSLGVDDFAYFSKYSKYGGMYYYFGITSKDITDPALAHTSEFIIDESSFKSILLLQLKNILTINKKNLHNAG